MITKYSLLILFLMMFCFNTYAQYEMSLRNDVFISDNQYEFDVYIKSTSGKINLTSYQIVLSFNESIKNNGELTFEYIPGSSQLINTPDASVGIVSDLQNDNLTAASGPGNDTITYIAVKIGTFRIIGSNSFGITTPNIDWKFGGYIRTETDINDTDKTNNSNYINILHNPTVNVKEEILPMQYVLYQNYPNPFNASTKINFNIPQASEVNLSVYNILGKKVATLLNGFLESGLHSVIFDGRNLASGTYIYRLQTPIFIQTKKMLLLK